MASRPRETWVPNEPKGYLIARGGDGDGSQSLRRLRQGGRRGAAEIRRQGSGARRRACGAGGEARPRNVVLAFGSFAQAQAYNHSAEYKAAKMKREGIATADIVAVQAQKADIAMSSSLQGRVRSSLARYPGQHAGAGIDRDRQCRGPCGPERRRRRCDHRVALDHTRGRRQGPRGEPALSVPGTHRSCHRPMHRDGRRIGDARAGAAIRAWASRACRRRAARSPRRRLRPCRTSACGAVQNRSRSDRGTACR
jgi:uncharacterized protein (DUF1330 family)